MIPDIHNDYLRRTVLVLTVAAIIVAFGPWYLVSNVLGWVEDEFEVNLRAVWRGKVRRPMQ